MTELADACTSRQPLREPDPEHQSQRNGALNGQTCARISDPPWAVVLAAAYALDRFGAAATPSRGG